MKVTNAIRKLEKAGFTVTATSYAKPELVNAELPGAVHSPQALAWTATLDGSTHQVEFHRNGRDEDVVCIRVRRSTEQDDIQSDYIAGIFVDTITQAIKLVEGRKREAAMRAGATLAINTICKIGNVGPVS